MYGKYDDTVTVATAKCNETERLEIETVRQTREFMISKV